MFKKIIKGLLWIIWTPFIIVGLVLVMVLGVFVVGSYSVEYGKDYYNISEPYDYSTFKDENKFYVDENYDLIVDNSNLAIANKFNNYVENIIGDKLEIKNNVGSNNYIKLVVNESLEDDYVINYEYYNNISISANNKDHLMRAAYRFLEEFGGVKAYTSKMIKYTSNEIYFPRMNGVTEKYNDYFEMRDTDFISPKDDEYSWFRGFNTDEYRYQDNNVNYSDYGGRVQYISGFCHTFTGDFVNKDEHYKQGKDLECYALDSNGNRRDDELCCMNPKTAEICISDVQKILDSDRYDSTAPLQIISLTQTDDMTGCKCEDCLREAKAHNGYAYTNLVLVNKVAKHFKEISERTGQYKNVVFDTFAYRYTRHCPTDIIPEDNVIIRLCSIECCCSHYIDDPKCLTNVSFMNDLSDWGKICDRIYIWDYCTNFAHYMSVFPNIEVLAHNLRIFYENGVKGVYEEGDYSLNKNGYDPEFAELRSYVISKVLENPYCDYQKVIDEFCNAYYGSAGSLMAEFVRKTDKIAGRRHLNIYKTPEWALPCTSSEQEQLNNLFNEAKIITNQNGEVEANQNVKNSELCWRYYKMYAKALEFSDFTQSKVLEEQLYKDIIKNTNQERFHEIDEHVFKNNLQQTAIIDLHLLFDLIVGNFLYGP